MVLRAAGYAARLGLASGPLGNVSRRTTYSAVHLGVRFFPRISQPAIMTLSRGLRPRRCGGRVSRPSRNVIPALAESRMQSLSSLLGVVFAAALATLGGFLSGRLSASLERRRRARASALLCSEVLNALQHVLTQITEVHGRGDPFGTVTMRFVRAARREIEVYERNREATFELRNSELRGRIHALMLQLAIPLEHMMEEAARTAALPSIAGDRASNEAAAKLEDAFSFFRSSCDLIPPMLTELRPLAKT
jgi:hypothetical protein